MQIDVTDIPQNLKGINDENLNAIVLKDGEVVAEVFIIPRVNEPVTVVVKPGLLEGFWKSLRLFGTKYEAPDDEY